MTQTPKRFSDALVYGRDALVYGLIFRTVAIPISWLKIFYSICPEKSAKIAALSLAPLACASGTASGRILLALAHFALAALEFFANSGSVSAARKFQ